MKDFTIHVTAVAGYTPKVTIQIEHKPSYRVPDCYSITNKLGELANTDIRVFPERFTGEDEPGDVNIFSETFERRQIVFKTPHGKTLLKQQVSAPDIDYIHDSAELIKEKIQARVVLLESLIQEVLDERDEWA